MASTSSSSSWIPFKGRHPVNVGTSLTRAIKNRKLKGKVSTAKKSVLPELDFYSFKFNFKASSINTNEPAKIEIKNGAENTQVVAKYPGVQSGEVHSFTGNEQVAKDVDCILIFDEDTGLFTLEKLDSYVILKYDGKKTKSVDSHEGSPPPAAALPSSSKGKGKQTEFEGSGLDEDADAEGEVDMDMEEVIAPSISQRQEEEEGEEGEIEVPKRKASPPNIPPPEKPSGGSRPVKPLPKSRVEGKAPTPASFPPTPLPRPKKVAPTAAPPQAAVPPPPIKAKPVASKAKKAKPTSSTPLPTTSYADEEVMEFGELTKPAKHARPSTPQQAPPLLPAAPVSLSLPGASSSFSFPPAPASSKPSTSSSRGMPPPPMTAAPPSPVAITATTEIYGDDDDDEDWEQVPTTTPVIPSANFNITMDEEVDVSEPDLGVDLQLNHIDYDDVDAEDIDANLFEQEIDEEMGRSDDDFLAAVVSPVLEARRPMSLNQLASGTTVNADSDDDYSSSEDSDEE